jgi:formylglycine-generating enzyme required for sulfatase activity
MVFVPAGEFLMGASDAQLSLVGAGGPPKLSGGDEQPQHPVNVDAFWIDQTEVTNAQFSNFVNTTGYRTTAEVEEFGTSLGDRVEGATFFHPRGPETGIDDKPNHPVVQVTWEDAKTYCEWVGARLPTEAEWEKAAKGAANDRVFPWGNQFRLPEFDVATVTNFCSASCGYEEGQDPNVDDGYPYTAPVGSFPAGASPYGALDMAGNVWEWVAGFYEGYPGNTYELSEEFGDYFRVVRGGSWDNSAQHVRATFRQNNPPGLRSDGTGFRCAISASDFEPAAADEAAPAEPSPAEGTAEPTAEPTGEPPTEPTAEPTGEPTAEPTAEVTAEPTAEPTVEATAEPPAEPTAEPTAEPDAGG